MVTQKGNNTYVVGITGNFDDAQTAVKKMFNDKELEAELDAAGYQSHLRTLSILDVWYRRSFIMYMHMHHLYVRARSKTVRRSMW